MIFVSGRKPVAARPSFPIPSSVTHQHITAAINTLLEDWAGKETVRILDFGCGDGKLLDFMHDALPRLRPDLSFDFFGLDVYDANVQQPGFIEETRRFLSSRNDGPDWDNRIACVSINEYWPYMAESFDFVTSNMVMEHVKDHGFVFGEIRRCLRAEGYSINLFPTREVLWEGHVRMPMVHRLKDQDKRARLAFLFCKIGFAKKFARRNDADNHGREWKTTKEFSQVVSNILEEGTNYLTTSQVVATARNSGLKISFLYTKNFFLSKILSYFGRRPYIYRDWGLLEPVIFTFCKRLSSVCVMMKKSAMPQGQVTDE